eukprot:CCRYP_020472-RA/>CCRYP_020472-RA protein AED:0.38 eAED:0.45 QI:0/0/0.5/1/0/0/2/513/215
MPPHVELVHNQSEWQAPRHSQSTVGSRGLDINALCGCLDSPLFRDEVDDPNSRQLCHLDRQQSDTDLVSAGSHEIVPAGGVKTAIPVMSKIESIIGPESRYYKNEPLPQRSSVISQPQPTPAVVEATSQPPIQAELHECGTTTKYNKSSDRRPFMMRMTRRVSKKGWKVVRFIGEKGRRFMVLLVNAMAPTSPSYEVWPLSAALRLPSSSSEESK